MRTEILTILLVFCQFVAMAQEDNFQKYINNFKERELPMEFNSDSLGNYFSRYDKKLQKSKNDNSEISTEYVLKFICSEKYPCEKVNKSNFYSYGFKFTFDKYTIAIFNMNCSDCTTKFGLWINYFYMIVYDKSGKIIDEKIIGKSSDQHFAIGEFEKSENNKDLLSLNIKNGTMLEYVVNTVDSCILDGDLDYYNYTVNDKGIIEEKKINSKKCRYGTSVCGDVKCNKIIKELD
ncbi:MAG: hypothetical protein Q4F97_07085 [Bacteroidales bacterium]|nr:hypothetical protein [Bacteroidales bacterium]